MSNRFCNPDDQYANNTGTPYSGGFLYFYASGTATPQNTWSDSALSAANANPVVLDSAGRPGSVFLSNLAYKVILKDSSGNTIWTMDPVSTSDFSGSAQIITFAGNPNGSVAGTAGSGTTPSSVVWDRTNNVLYVCTTTGTTSTAVWTAVNSAAITAALPRPGGYLTLTSTVPIITSDVADSASVYYTPYQTNQCPVYNGSSFVIFSFTEQTLSLNATAHLLNSIYDVFAFSNSGTFTVGTGPAWTIATAGSGARGAGAGTTQLQLVNGLWVNAVQMTVKNDGNSYTVSANQGTYLGSIIINGTAAAQATCQRTYGQSRKWGVWNAYNRAPIYLKAGDPTSSWTYTSGTIRPSNNSALNSLTVFVGLAEEIMEAKFIQNASMSGAAANININMTNGIGYNVTNAVSGKSGIYNLQLNFTGTNGGGGGELAAQYTTIPSIGIQTITAVERVPTNSGVNATYNGTESNMLLSAIWRG